MNFKHINCMILIGIYSGMLGCNHELWTTKDEWFLDCTAIRLPYTKESEIDKRFVHPVRQQAIDKSIAMLSDRPIVKLPPDQAKQFINDSLVGTDSRQPFLVRGVYLNSSGAFMVYRIGNTIHVIHESLGHKAVPMKKWPIIIELANEPTEVYITCSMAE